MTISERTLKEWRRQALEEISVMTELRREGHKVHTRTREYSDRILRLTQELLDIHLISRYKPQGSSGGRICLEHPNIEEVEKKS